MFTCALHRLPVAKTVTSRDCQRQAGNAWDWQWPLEIGRDGGNKRHRYHTIYHFSGGLQEFWWEQLPGISLLSRAREWALVRKLYTVVLSQRLSVSDHKMTRSADTLRWVELYSCTVDDIHSFSIKQATLKLIMAVSFFLLRCWIGLVGVIAVVNALQCYWDPHYASRRIYTLNPKQGRVKSGSLVFNPTSRMHSRS